MNERAVRLGIDVGGKFTDVVLVTAGEVRTAKVPTAEDQSEGVIEGIRTACEEAGIGPESVDSFRHAMTAGTNALIGGGGVFLGILSVATSARKTLPEPAHDP
jgi:N-methylhydantoinase A